MSRNPNNWWKLMKIACTDGEILHIFCTIWGISIKFSGKMWLMIILKVTKIQGFTLSFEDRHIFRKITGGVKLTLPPAVLAFNFFFQNYYKICVTKKITNVSNLEHQCTTLGGYIGNCREICICSKMILMRNI